MKRRGQIVALLAGLWVAACGAPFPADTPNEHSAAGAAVRIDTPPAGQLPRGVTPTAYRLALETDPAQADFKGRVEIDIALDAPHARIWLHALGPKVLKAKAVLANGKDIAARFVGGLAEGGVSRLDFEEPLPQGSATLVLDYTAPYNLGLVGLYKSFSGDTPYLATQMEAIDARRAVPSFDEPRFKTPWTISVIAPAGQRVVTNGPLLAQTDVGDGRIRHDFAPTRPIQSYLVALAVGPYDERIAPDLPATALRGRPIRLRGFAAAGKGEKLTDALTATGPLLAIQEDYFDYPYPYSKLDLLAVPDFAYGAMENAGAIIYREGALLIDARTSLSQRRQILTIHAHELAHQWFGNLVTPKWWDDIWLNEAFATWMSYKTMHAFDPEGGFDRLALRRGLSAMSADALSNARQIRNPIHRNADILDAFDAITYSKGGGVLNMFEAYLGETAFREGLRLHMRRFEDGVADTRDFMTSLATGSGNQEVIGSFSSFILQPGTPFLETDLECKADGTGLLTVTQSRYAPLGSSIDRRRLWQVPFAARTSAGEKVRQLLTDRQTQIALQSCADGILPNADGTGYWRFDTSAENWAWLAQNFSNFSPGEQLVYTDSLMASFKAGRVDAHTLLQGLRASAEGEWDGVMQPLSIYGDLFALLDEPARDHLRSWLLETYQPHLTLLEAMRDPSQGQVLLRDRLKDLMTLSARDNKRRLVLLERAKAYIGVSRAPDRNALDPSAFRSAMAVGAEEGGKDFFDTALNFALASNNQTEEGIILSALGAGSQPEQAIQLFDELLGPRVTGRELFATLFALMSNPTAQDQIWSKVQTHFAAIAEKLPEIRKPDIAGLAGQFCDAQKADAARAFFEAQGDLIEGYERTLAQGVERAKLCAALRSAKSGELADALEP